MTTADRIASLLSAGLSPAAERILAAALARIDAESRRTAALMTAIEALDPAGHCGPYALATRIAGDIARIESRNIRRRIELGTRRASDYEMALCTLAASRSRVTTMANVIKAIRAD